MNYEFDYEPEEHTATETDSGEEPEFEIFYQARPEEAKLEEINSEEARAGKSGSDEADLLSEFPDELREKPTLKRSLLATMCWGFGALLLLIIITTQLAWFNRDELLLRYPQLDPVARKICDRLQCEILRYKDISSIKLLNRDVRNHPLYEGSLLVNATMANKSETIQPFPLIQLALFNPGGEVIGYREFKPDEYLDDSINIPAGMMPESPIHFVLEVGGPTEGAVSFEFHFL
jgi:hypothetical protein